MDKTEIYFLADPISNDIKYVGKTNVGLTERLFRHIQGAERSKSPTRKEKWILYLKANGLKPNIRLIECVDKKDWRDKEVYWITKMKENGSSLFNLKKGGGGYDNLTHTEAFKKAISTRMMGNKYGQGKKWTDSQRELMMKSRSNPWNKGKKGLVKHSDETKLKMSNSRKGENHAMARLTNNDVSDMRESYSNGIRPIDISRKYNINYRHCLKILKNQSWR